MRRLFVCVFLFSTLALAQPVVVRQYLLRLEPVRKDFSLQNLTQEERRIAGEHVTHLRRLQAEGKAVFAGQAFDANRGFWGILVVNAADAAAATELLNADPAIQQKMLRGEIIPFRTVIAGPAESTGSK